MIFGCYKYCLLLFGVIFLTEKYLIQSMPELPEVESMRRSFQRLTLHQKILQICAFEQGGGPREGLFDEKVIPNTDPALLSKDLTHSSIVSTGRKGKHLSVSLSNQKCLLFHFGMTGSLVFKGQSTPQYKTFKVSDTWPPKYTKLELVLDSLRVAFCDPRRLGRIRVIQEEDLYTSPSSPFTKLARDPFLEDVPLEEIYSIFQRSSMPVKGLLLDQEKCFSGVGNWVADEVLFQTAIHPSTKSNQLTMQQVESLSKKIKEVVTTAVECLEEGANFPSDWLFHQRWRNKKAGGVMADGATIHFETVAGRTSAIVTPIGAKKTEVTAKRRKKEMTEVVKDVKDIDGSKLLGVELFKE